MLISELAETVQLPVSTIRYYERQSLLTDMHFKRQGNRYRVYNEHALERIRLIKAAQLAGITIREMRTHLDEWEANSISKDQKQAFFTEKLHEIDQRLLGLQQMRQYLVSKLEGLSESDIQ